MKDYTILGRVANGLGIAYDKDAVVACATEAGYTYALTTFQNIYTIIAKFSLVDQDNRKPNDLNLRGLVSAVKKVGSAKANGNIVTIRFKSAITANGKAKNVISSIPEVINWFRMNGYSNCAEETLEPAETKVFINHGVIHFYTEEVANQMLIEHAEEQATAPVVAENYALGTVFALGGVIVGAILIVIIGQLGYISLVAGVAMGFLTLTAYQKGAGKMSKIGIVICFVLMLIGVYYAHKFDYALSVTRFFHENGYSDVRMMNAFGVIPEMMEKGIIESADYYTMFAFQCVAALGGAISPLVALLQKNKAASITRILG